MRCLVFVASLNLLFTFTSNAISPTKNKSTGTTQIRESVTKTAMLTATTKPAPSVTSSVSVTSTPSGTAPTTPNTTKTSDSTTSTPTATSSTRLGTTTSTPPETSSTRLGTTTSTPPETSSTTFSTATSTQPETSSTTFSTATSTKPETSSTTFSTTTSTPSETSSTTFSTTTSTPPETSTTTFRTTTSTQPETSSTTFSTTSTPPEKTSTTFSTATSTQPETSLTTSPNSTSSSLGTSSTTRLGTSTSIPTGTSTTSSTTKSTTSGTISTQTGTSSTTSPPPGTSSTTLGTATSTPNASLGTTTLTPTGISLTTIGKTSSTQTETSSTTLGANTSTRNASFTTTFGTTTSTPTGTSLTTSGKTLSTQPETSSTTPGTTLSGTISTLTGTSLTTTSGTTSSVHTERASTTASGTPTTMSFESTTSISPATPLTTITSSGTTITQSSSTTPGETATMTEQTSKPLTTTHYTSVPTEAPIFGEESIFQLQIVLTLVNISEISPDVELILKEKLNQMVFLGYTNAVKNTSFSSKNSKRSVISSRRNNLNRDGSANNLQSETKNISVIIQISVNSLRDLHRTIHDFVNSVSTNFLHNITEITDSSWSALNTTYDIMEQLEIQTNDISECNATGRLCVPGYKCRPSHKNNYTGICYHICDLETRVCYNGGHCYFDAIKNSTGCSCTTTWRTVYHGADCMEQAGQIIPIVGFSVGSLVIFIAIIVVIAIIRRWKCHDHQSKLGNGAYDVKSGSRSDFPSEPDRVEGMEFNYRESTKINYSVNEDCLSDEMKYQDAETERKSPSTQKDQRIDIDSKSQDVIETNFIPESDVITAPATTLQETKHDIKSSQLSVITTNVPDDFIKRQTNQEISGPFNPRDADIRRQKSFLFGSKSS
eukprot:XP_019924067.1 PREDICTED: cell wall protein DAN4 isoform X2 [Crassostrea gigas]